MRVVATGDFHGLTLPDIPECDLFVYAGDVGEEGFAFGPFAKWLSAIPAKHKVGVAGNHDWWATPSKQTVHDKDSRARELPWTYLYNEHIEINGHIIWGSPFCNRFYDWAFMGDEDLLSQVWETMPDGTALAVTHGPPYGACDRVARVWGRDDPSVGSTSLRERLQAVDSVRYAVCGHIHEGYGSAQIEREDGSSVQVFNVSIVNEHYKVVNQPVSWEM